MGVRDNIGVDTRRVGYVMGPRLSDFGLLAVQWTADKSDRLLLIKLDSETDSLIDE